MKLQRLKKSEKLCFYTLALLGVICIWNLHEIGQKFIGIDRVLSPVILALCLFGVYNTPKLRYLQGQGRQSIYFLGALLSYIGIGTLSAFLNNETGNMFSTAFSMVASIVLMASVVHMVSGLVLQGHHVRIIRMAFFLSLFATLTVYLSFFVPWISQFLSVKAAGRMAGLYRNPNMLALQTLFTIVFAFTLSSYTLKSSYLIIGYIASIPTILLTNSRTSIISMMIVTVTLSFMVFPPKYIVRALFAFLFLVGAALGSVTYLNSVRTTTSSNWVQQKLADRTDQLFDLFSGKITAETTGGRLALGEEAINIWKRNPILGNGIGNLNKMPIHGIGPHNTYLKILGESGVFALLMFAGAWVALGFRGMAISVRWCQVLVFGIFLVGSFCCLTSHIVLAQRHVNFCLAIGFAFANPILEPILRRDGQRRTFVFFANPELRQQPGRPGQFLHPGRPPMVHRM